jgi:hypothetical protein
LTLIQKAKNNNELLIEELYLSNGNFLCFALPEEQKILKLDELLPIKEKVKQSEFEINSINLLKELGVIK